MHLTVTKQFEFDTAHRLPHHSGKCRNVHGHRYVLDVTLSGPLKPDQGLSSEGMIIDFADFKQFVKEALVDRWDHALLLHEGDRLLEDASLWDDQKLIRTSYVPTVENMALDAFQILKSKLLSLPDGSRFKLRKVRLYETPTCWADVEDA